jgi:transposase
MPKQNATKARAVPAIRSGGTVPLEVRLKIVQAVKRGGKHADVAMAFGVSMAAVAKYVALFEAGGVEGLKPRLHGAAA